MAVYFATLTFCWVSAFYQTCIREPLRTLEFCVVATLAALSGLRFETGYDWLGYQRYFDEIPTIADLLAYGDFESFGHMEPLYGLLNATVKSLGLPFQTVLIVVALINAVAILTFLRRHSQNVVFCLAVYFCWVYLKLQMGGMRQSLSCSMMLYAITAAIDKKQLKYYLMVLAAMGFQYSAVVFLALGPMLRVNLSRTLTDPMLVAGVIVLLGKIDFIRVVTPILNLISFGFVRAKLEYYLGGALYAPPAINYAYAVGALAFLFAMRKWLDISKRPSDQVFYNLTLVLVLVELFCWQMPWFWNRLFYFTILPQTCLLTRVMQNAKPSFRLNLFGSVAAVSTLLFAYFITRPDKSLPYVPYQSYTHVMLTGDYGDGDARTLDYYRAVAHTKER